MDDNVFKINNLHLFYNDKEALKGINMEIKRNKVTALIGPSGCGKSTFLRCFDRMNDLIDNCKITGDIYYNDKNILDYDVIKLRSEVGMVFQNPNPFLMSIYDNVAYGPRCAGIKRKEILNDIVIDALKKASLFDEVKDRLKDSATSLSGGQQQRLCIARCLAMNPKVILMDEPTSALDPIATLKIEELISSLKESYTIIIVTHNMQQAARISDYTAFFILGEVAEYTTTNELFKNPKDKRTEDYITGRFG